MVQIYVDLITRDGSTFTLDMVPERWREAVREALSEHGIEPDVVTAEIPEVSDGLIAHRA